MVLSDRDGFFVAVGTKRSAIKFNVIPHGHSAYLLVRLKFFGNSIIVFRRLVTDYEANSQNIPLELERWFQNRVGDAMTQVHTYLNDKSGPFIKGMVVPDAPWLNDSKQWDQVGMWQMTEVAVAWGYSV